MKSWRQQCQQFDIEKMKGKKKKKKKTKKNVEPLAINNRSSSNNLKSSSKWYMSMRYLYKNMIHSCQKRDKKCWKSEMMKRVLSMIKLSLNELVKKQSSITDQSPKNLSPKSFIFLSNEKAIYHCKIVIVSSKVHSEMLPLFFHFHEVTLIFCFQFIQMKSNLKFI